MPANYLKKLVNTDDIWEVRVDVGHDAFRLLGFFDGRELVVLTNSFQKKTQQTPLAEIRCFREAGAHRRSAVLHEHSSQVRMVQNHRRRLPE